MSAGSGRPIRNYTGWRRTSERMLAALMPNDWPARVAVQSWWRGQPTRWPGSGPTCCCSGPAAAQMNTSEISTCLYQKDAGSSVAVGILPAQDKNGKAIVLARQAMMKNGGRSVTPIPGLCDAAFTMAIKPDNTTLVAGKGPWQVEVQAVVAQKPNVDAEQKIARTVCSRLP